VDRSVPSAPTAPSTTHPACSRPAVAHASSASSPASRTTSATKRAFRTAASPLMKNILVHGDLQGHRRASSLDADGTSSNWPCPGKISPVEFELRVQAVVWLGGSGPLAILFCDDPARTAIVTTAGETTDLLISMVQELGLPWLLPSDPLSFESAAGWWCRSDREHQLTVDWPSRSGYPFLADLDVPWPSGWWHAVKAKGFVILVCGRFEPLGERNPFDVLMSAAADGGLAGGAVTFEPSRSA
jgi:hypothetical protein